MSALRFRDPIRLLPVLDPPPAGHARNRLDVLTLADRLYLGASLLTARYPTGTITPDGWSLDRDDVAAVAHAAAATAYAREDCTREDYADATPDDADIVTAARVALLRRRPPASPSVARLFDHDARKVLAHILDAATDAGGYALDIAATDPHAADYPTRHGSALDAACAATTPDARALAWADARAVIAAATLAGVPWWSGVAACTRCGRAVTLDPSCSWEHHSRRPASCPLVVDRAHRRRVR